MDLYLNPHYLFLLSKQKKDIQIIIKNKLKFKINMKICQNLKNNFKFNKI